MMRSRPKLGNVSWICVYAACKGRFLEVQTHRELLQHYATTQDKTQVYAFGYWLQFTKTYFFIKYETAEVQ
jgi:hypothetical protein